jgi:hypothetical protein
MKVCFTYLLIFSISLQSFGLNAMNMSHLSSLISHYEHHKIEHNNSFLEFIDLHYGSQKEAHSDEHDEHQNLPFQEGFVCISSIYFSIPEVFELSVVHVFTNKKNTFNYQSSFSYLHAKKILQPPKHLIDVIS